MEINQEVLDTLAENKSLDPKIGLLYLLSLYHELGSENIKLDLNDINAVNLNRIAEYDYSTDKVIWNIPLYKSDIQVSEFDWVRAWVRTFVVLNPDRRCSNSDAIARMKKFFAAYPHIRKEEVIQATRNYIASVKDPQYIKSPLKFIMEGTGAYRTSPLLGWCEKLEPTQTNENTKGLIK